MNRTPDTRSETRGDRHDDPFDGAAGDDAVVHALLQEQLAAEGRRTTDPADIVARFAAGDGARAHALLQRSNGREWWRRPTTWVAALALVSVGAVFAWSWNPGERSGRDEAHGGGAPQDPQHGETPAHAEPVSIADMDQLRALFAEVQKVTIEVLRLPDTDLPGDVPVEGVVLELPPVARTALLEDLASDARRVEPIGADWQNRVTFRLGDGRWFRAAIYPYGSNDAGVRLNMQRFDGDLRVGALGSRVLRELLDQATRTACHRHGVVLSKQDLKSLPDDRTELRLFRLADQDLDGLARFRGLRRLDLSGLRGRLGPTGVETIAKRCPELRELVLDGLELDDETFGLLTPLTKLERLSMRRLEAFTGTGFAAFSRSQLHRAGPLHVDLSWTRSLTDDGMRAICGWDPYALLLRGCGELVTRDGFRALLDTERLGELDIRDWPAKDKGVIPTINALRRRAGLTLRE